MGKKKKKNRFWDNLRNNPSAFTDILGGLLTAFDAKNAGAAMQTTPKDQPKGKPRVTMGGIGTHLLGVNRSNSNPFNKTP